VSSLGVRGQPDEEKRLDIKLTNWGSVPAIDVMISVRYYPEAIPTSGTMSVGVIFPGSDASIAITVPEAFFFFPVEKEETVLESGKIITEHEIPDLRKGVSVYCRVTYRQAQIPILDSTPSYCTYQPLCVTVDGRCYPSDSEPAEIT
jgi:hypothetical protein